MIAKTVSLAFLMLRKARDPKCPKPSAKIFLVSLFWLPYHYLHRLPWYSFSLLECHGLLTCTSAANWWTISNCILFGMVCATTFASFLVVNVNILNCVFNQTELHRHLLTAISSYLATQAIINVRYGWTWRWLASLKYARMQLFILLRVLPSIIMLSEIFDPPQILF